MIMHSLTYSWQQACYLCVLRWNTDIECVVPLGK